jgi:CIC family chloride channel protein
MSGLLANLTRHTSNAITPNLRRFVATRQTELWMVAVALGVGVAGAAIAFRAVIGMVQYSWLGTSSETMIDRVGSLPFWAVIIAPAAGGLVVGLLLQFALPNRRAEVVADVIEAKAIKGGRMGLGTGLLSAAVAAISLGSGASAGREGPVVHLGATLGSWIAGRLHLPAGSTRTLLGCGVAAAIAASFNAPIAGVLFALEVILGHYALSAFVPIVICAVAATVITRIQFGNFPAFAVPDYAIMSFYEFPAFALLGIVCAAVAISFQFALITTDRIARGITMPVWARPVIGGLMVGAIGVFLPEILGVGYAATDAALRQQYSLAMLLVLIVAKTAATAITLASRFGGGVFSPSLYLGAMAGGAFGIIAAMAFPEQASSHGLYALIGMGGVAAAVLGAPISTILIVFELTGGFEVAIALMLTISISSGLTQAVYGRSYFHLQLESRGLVLTEGAHRTIMFTLAVRDFMTPLGPDEPAPRLPEDARRLTPDDTLETALRLFDHAGGGRLPVVAARDSDTVVGWVTHVAALDRFNKGLIDANVEEHR